MLQLSTQKGEPRRQDVASGYGSSNRCAFCRCKNIGIGGEASGRDNGLFVHPGRMDDQSLSFSKLQLELLATLFRRKSDGDGGL